MGNEGLKWKEAAQSIRCSFSLSFSRCRKREAHLSSSQVSSVWIVYIGRAGTKAIFRVSAHSSRSARKGIDRVDSEAASGLTGLAGDASL